MNKPVILCIDDERLVLNSLKSELKEEFGNNHTITIAETPEEAIEIFMELIEERIDVPLIISDYIMPNIKGDELLKKFHELSPQSLKIMLTGQATTEGVANAVNWARLYRYMAKPWEAEDMNITVREALKSFNQTVQLERQNEELKHTNEVLEHRVMERTQEIVEKNYVLEQQKNELDFQHTNIKDSIKAAFRIQQAILPPDSFVKEVLPQSFVFYRPKDIVSGDFYLIEEKNNLLLFSVVDCTGHGIPGAFMSIIGHSILNQAIHEKNITNPAEILDFLNGELSLRLWRSCDEKMIKDGMDLALCVLNKNLMKLEYAGIHNPMYLVRNGIITEYRPDSHPINEPIEGDFKGYTNNSIDLQPNDSIYLFSDGYVDQFGGPNRKKFLSKRLREVLLEIQPLSMNEQKQKLTDIFEEWRGDIEQYDDVLIMGIKV